MSYLLTSRPRRDRDVPKNVSRPPRHRDVQDRYNIPSLAMSCGRCVVNYSQVNQASHCAVNVYRYVRVVRPSTAIMQYCVRDESCCCVGSLHVVCGLCMSWTISTVEFRIMRCGIFIRGNGNLIQKIRQEWKWKRVALGTGIAIGTAIRKWEEMAIKSNLI